MRSNEVERPARVRREIHHGDDSLQTKGFRTTIYKILECMLDCWTPDRIVTLLGITPGQMMAALGYIRAHKIEVLTGYVKDLKRLDRGKPAKLQAKLVESHAADTLGPDFVVISRGDT
jgi:hypothetical protein